MSAIIIRKAYVIALGKTMECIGSAGLSEYIRCRKLTKAEYAVFGALRVRDERKRAERRKRMADVELVSHEIRRINMFNNIQEDLSVVQLENNIKFDIKYGQDDESAVATLISCMRHREHPGMFCIELQIRGTFRLSDIKNSDVKKQTNIMCYKQLVTYANQIMSYLATNSGMEGLRLKKSFIIPQCVNFEVEPDDENSGKIIGFRADV